MPFVPSYVSLGISSALWRPDNVIEQICIAMISALEQVCSCRLGRPAPSVDLFEGKTVGDCATVGRSLLSA
jgi:hypothetical protein